MLCINIECRSCWYNTNITATELTTPSVKVTGYSCACHAKCIGECILKLANQNLWYEQREQLDPRGGGALSQGAGHDGSFYRYAV